MFWKKKMVSCIILYDALHKDSKYIIAYFVLVSWGCVQIRGSSRASIRKVFKACFFLWNVIQVTCCRSYLETSSLWDVYNQSLLMHSFIPLVVFLSSYLLNVPYMAGTALGSEGSRRNLATGAHMWVWGCARQLGNKKWMNSGITASCKNYHGNEVDAVKEK